MSAPIMNVGTLVGYLTLDDKGVDKGAKSATQKIKEFGQEGAKEGAKAGQKIGKAAGDGTADEYGKAESKLQAKTRAMFGGIGKLALGILGGVGVAQVLTKGWDRLTGIENAQAKLRGLGHDGTEVKSIMNDALTSVKGTAFGLDEAATVAATAVAAGIRPGQDLESTLRLVADAAAIAGTGMSEMGSIFNKVAANGKLTTEVMLQLQDQGIPVLVKLAEHYKVTNAEAQKMVTEGKVSFEDFSAVMEDTVGGAALAMGETTTGTLKNMGAALGRLGADLLKDVVPAVKTTAEGVIWLADGWGKIPGPAKTAILVMGGFLALEKAGLFTRAADGAQKLVGWLGRIRSEGFAASGGVAAIGKAGALGVATLAVAGLTKAWQDAHKIIVDTGIAVDVTTGKLREGGREAIAEALTPHIDAIQSAGLTVNEVIDAVLAGGPALDEVVVKLDNAGGVAKGILDDLGHTFSAGLWASGADHAAMEIRALGNALGGAQRAGEDYAASAEAATDATEKFIGPTIEESEAAAAAADATRERARTLTGLSYQQQLAAESTDVMTASLKGFSDQTSSADQRLKFFTASVDRLSGRNIDLETATRQLNDQVRAIKDEFTDATKATKGNIESLISADGAINTVSEAGSKLAGVVEDYRAAYDAATQAAVDNAIANGATVPEAMAAGRKAADEARKKFLDQADALKISKNAAQDLADHYGILNGVKIDDKTFSIIATDRYSQMLQKAMAASIPDKTFNLIGKTSTTVSDTLGIPRGHFAAGGWISGGTPGRDSVPIMAMPGEAVIPTSNAQRNRSLVDDLIAGRDPYASLLRRLDSTIGTTKPEVNISQYFEAGPEPEVVGQISANSMLFAMGM